MQPGAPVLRVREPGRTGSVLCGPPPLCGSPLRDAIQLRTLGVIWDHAERVDGDNVLCHSAAPAAPACDRAPLITSYYLAVHRNKSFSAPTHACCFITNREEKLNCKDWPHFVECPATHGAFITC